MTSRTKTPVLPALTSEQIDALVAYATEHGEGWKTELGTEWMRGSAPAELHALRNSHGGTWLKDYVLAGTKPYFVAFFPNRWGRGYSIEEAIAAARANGGKGREYFVHAIPEGALEAWVDDMGRLCWRGAEPGASSRIVLAKPESLARKFVAEGRMEASS